MARVNKRDKEKKRLKKRSAPSKPEKPSILIVCEGENTEPSYFKQFRLKTATIEADGQACNTISLVNRAVELKSKKRYDQVWCVFDKDDFSDQDFNNAVQLAQNHKFGVAYSNQSFEYWIILHFNNHQGGGMHRKLYNKEINKLLTPYGVNYDGNGTKQITKELFDLLDEKKYDAIQRAKKIYQQWAGTSPAKAESSTTVFRLVEELLKYI